MNRKLIFSTGMIFLSLLCEFFLWKYAILLLILFVLLAYIKHKIYPIKKELLWYVLICVGGAIAEFFLINFGHGWTYSNPDFLGIPIWIPFFWSLIGTTIIVLYDGLTSNNE